jgi:ATP-dependent RNA helicase DeaD
MSHFEISDSMNSESSSSNSIAITAAVSETVETPLPESRFIDTNPIPFDAMPIADVTADAVPEAKDVSTHNSVDVTAAAPIAVAAPVAVAAPIAVAKSPAPVAEVPAALAPPVVAAPVNGFRKLSLSEPIMQAIEHAGYTTPTPIQEQTIPLLLEGRDLVGQAQTGSGKTGAFALPLLQRIDLNVNQPQVLVLVPTRELAIQVAAAFENYAARMSQLRVIAIYGGAAYQPQFTQLRRGVHVVVGTPGRIMDHMNRGSLNLGALKCLVLDEADEMLRMGFAESVEWVLTQLPQERQIALFSATMPEPIRRIAQQHLRNPAEVTIRQKTATADTIRQRFLVVGHHQKEQALARILEGEPVDGAIVFVKMKSTTEPLAEFLSQRGYKAAALNGDIAQAQRERIIEQLKSGRLDIVVATDVAARGLDVQRISHVFNYDLPGDSEAYVHRIGRTGRAGRSGEAILFVHPKAQRMLKSLEYATRQKIEPMDLPTNRQINKQRVARFHGQITEHVTNPLAESMGSLIEQYRRENPDVSIEQLMAALAVMANGGLSLLTREELKQEAFFENRSRESRDGRGPRRDVRGPSGDFGGRGPRDRFGADRGRPGRIDERDGSRQRSPGTRPDGPPRQEKSGPRDQAGFERAPGNQPPFGEDRRAMIEQRFSDDRRSRRSRPGDEDKETYRIEVGHNHQVRPGNIVGAIANEAGIDSAQIGRIEIFDDFSTVDLPQGMPSEVFNALKKVWVSGQQLRLSRADAPSIPRRSGPERAPRSGGKPRGRRVNS